MKGALVHDWLIARGGAERTLEAVAEMYPFPVYTLFCDRKCWESTSLAQSGIKTSFLQKLPWACQFYRAYAPLFPLAIEQFDMGDREIVLSFSHSAAKGVLTHARQLHLCYCFTPMRYAWDFTHQYLSGMSKIGRPLARGFLHYLRNWDIASLNRVDHFIANSHYVAKRIRKLYQREATVIYSPVDTSRIACVRRKEDFFVTVSRLVPYKRIDLIAEAFAHLPEEKLVIIGEGPEMGAIRKKAGRNVHLLGFQEEAVVHDYLGRAKGFLFASEEDFGIIPVEAQAAGTPVIALGRGGALETVLDQRTGLFFAEQTVGSIVATVGAFLKKQWDPDLIRQHAIQFSKERFQREFKQFVESKIDESRCISRR